jgi:ribonuclease BN (tRNA processing enzyme)
VRLTLRGTRGSQASPGPDTVRYGGNTSCVELEATADARLILDAGTGLRVAGVQLPPAVRRVDLMLTHLHMDHIQGLGFFQPLFRPGFEVHIWGPGSATADLRARLTRYISPPLFPVRLSELPCDLHLHDLDDHRRDIPGFSVRADLVCHPGPTVGYRVTDDAGVLAYLPDHEPMLACHRFAEEPEWCSGHEVARDADLLIHDAQYTEEEYEARIGWGHSTLRHALAFARLARVRWLMPFHHDPAHDDDMLDTFFGAGGDQPFGLVPAREGATLDLADLGPA